MTENARYHTHILPRLFMQSTFRRQGGVWRRHSPIRRLRQVSPWSR